MSQISGMCGAGDGRPLVPGALRGYRTWRLRRRRAPPGGDALPLTSVTRAVVWGPTLTACCAPDSMDAPGPGAATPDGDHVAPAAECRCGIYGWYDPGDTGMLHARVFGVIEASGLVLMGERGFRAERARIVAVVSRNRRLTAACEEAGIAVYRRRGDLVRDCPPEDLSALLGDPPERDSPDRPQPVPPARPPWCSGFDWLVLAAVCGRVALIAAALALLPTGAAVLAAVVANLAFLSLVAAQIRH
jgi:hypothetical protein